MTNFINILAWIFGVLSTVIVIAKIYFSLTYSNLDKNIDALKGVKVSYPITLPGILMIICWAWILSH